MAYSGFRTGMCDCCADPPEGGAEVCSQCECFTWGEINEWNENPGGWMGGALLCLADCFMPTFIGTPFLYVNAQQTLRKAGVEDVPDGCGLCCTACVCSQCLACQIRREQMLIDEGQANKQASLDNYAGGGLAVETKPPAVEMEEKKPNRSIGA